jgi:hypothetical protein
MADDGRLCTDDSASHDDLYQERMEHPLLPSLHRVPRGSDADRHYDRVLAWAYRQTSGREGTFPGAHPVSTTEGDLERTVSSNSYAVTYKLDGKRFLCVLTRLPDPESTPKMVFVDRRMDKYECLVVAHRDFFSNSVFDGELVLHRADCALHYNVFDAVATCGRRLVDAPFHERLQTIHESFMDTTDLRLTMDVVAERVLEEHNVAVISDDPAPLRARPKAFWSPTRALKLWQSRADCLYDVDGLVFTGCDAPLCSGTDRTQLKWKPHWTVDVLLRTSADENEEGPRGDGGGLSGVPFACRNRGGGLCALSECEHFRYRVRCNHIGTRALKTGAVVECGAHMDDHDDDAAGERRPATRRGVLLVPMRIREDKDRANSANTVYQTTLSMANGVATYGTALVRLSDVCDRSAVR